MVEYFVLQKDGHTPLHVSAWEGDDVLVKYLHQNKANPNIVDKVGAIPFLWEIRNKSYLLM